MKMAPLLRAFTARDDLPGNILVHTGQHYDPNMNERLFSDLRLPVPDLNLEVGSGTHATQTAEIMRRFEPVVDAYEPSCVIVVGDVNSTLACSLVAAKKAIPVVHVEAGLRSFDRRMPEEINRILTDQLADILYVSEPSGVENLAREGVAAERIQLVGNVMIDSLNQHLPHAPAPDATLQAAGILPDETPRENEYALVTLHRPSNVDEPEALAQISRILVAVSERMPVVWPVHPRTAANLQRFGLEEAVTGKRMFRLPPQGYLQMLGLMRGAKVVLTDSGGVQEETTALGVPCLTLRENTERPATIEQGTNALVGRNQVRILELLDGINSGFSAAGRIPALWDGKAAERIAEHLAGWLAARDLNLQK
jgi:UDP-N-acetylglucosamine 2-epimerase (non-hydrolysing)